MTPTSHFLCNHLPLTSFWFFLTGSVSTETKSYLLNKNVLQNSPEYQLKLNTAFWYSIHTRSLAPLGYKKKKKKKKNMLTNIIMSTQTYIIKIFLIIIVIKFPDTHLLISIGFSDLQNENKIINTLTYNCIRKFTTSIIYTDTYVPALDPCATAL